MTNNAWRLWQDGDYWIHSGDFPSSPSIKIPKELTISHSQYSKAARDTCSHLSIKTQSPEHYVGYTIFFQGLNWISWNFKPCRILLLGFDHDYNEDKVRRWNDLGRPNPQNKFVGFNGRSADEVFADLKPDAFYGHGTPDPLRLKTGYLLELFQRAYQTLSSLGCECFNMSGNTSGLNPYPQYDSRRTLSVDSQPKEQMP